MLDCGTALQQPATVYPLLPGVEDAFRADARWVAIADVTTPPANPTRVEKFNRLYDQAARHSNDAFMHLVSCFYPFSVVAHICIQCKLDLSSMS